MCRKILVLDRKSGKVIPESRQCARCMAEGRKCKSQIRRSNSAFFKHQSQTDS